MYTYYEFLEMDNETQLNLVHREGTVILEQKSSYHHSVLYRMNNFNVELVFDSISNKLRINNVYCHPIHFADQPSYYK